MKMVTKAGVEKAFNKYQRVLERDFNWRTKAPGTDGARKAALALGRAEDEWRHLDRKFKNQ